MLLFHPSGIDCAKQTFQRVFVLFYYNTNLYNIVDQIFIANASYLGSYGNAMLFSAERRRGYQMSLLKHGITPRESCCPPEV